LRPGDPLFPLLFVIVMEVLGKVISAVVSEGLLFDFSMGIWTDISHLLFVDDTLLFCGSDPNQLCSLWSLFLLFEPVSCLKMNLAKSKLVLVGDVDNVDGLAGIWVVGLCLCP
jgi:hypothetical protein